jgi:hypothetical protein
MPLLADDNVVVHGNAERLRHLDDLLGHLDVRAGRRRVAGGMVVHNKTIRTTLLIFFEFFDGVGGQGTSIRGGTPRLGGIIMLPHARSRCSP